MQCELYTVPKLWNGGDCVVIATGQSLTLKDVEYIKGKCPVIVVNDSHRIANWADILYASDNTWWDYYKGVPEFKGLKITRDRNGGLEAAKKWDLLPVKLDISKKGFSHDPTYIHSGNNSGYQACNLAMLFGATRLLLLGFDMKGESHWFGDHPKELKRRHIYKTWLRKFNEVKQDGFEIINCTRDTALTCFKQSIITDEI